MFPSITLALAMLTAAVPVAAQTTPAPEPTPAAKVKKTCRTEGDTGSHFVRRICGTAEQWAVIDANAPGGPQRTVDGTHN